jgi:hypothetical protein
VFGEQVKIAKNDAQFVTATKAMRDLSRLSDYAACYAHNKGIGTKALDPMRDRENAKMVAALRRIIERVARVHARNEVSKALA